jgi:hypothetical protein
MTCSYGTKKCTDMWFELIYTRHHGSLFVSNTSDSYSTRHSNKKVMKRSTTTYHDRTIVEMWTEGIQTELLNKTLEENYIWGTYF